MYIRQVRLCASPAHIRGRSAQLKKMKKDISFQEFLNQVCSRPGMWVSKGAFQGVYCLIMGYTIGKEDTPLSGENWRTFNKYGCIKFGFPTKYVVEYVFESCAENDEEAIKLFQETVIEFLELQEKLNSDEILEYAATTFKFEEGEPEKIFRIFDEALLNADEHIIKPLIEEHEHQNILWKSSYPEDVGKLLSQISESQQLKRIYESKDKTKIRLLTADFPFPFEMNFKDGNWKIDASQLINLRMIQNKEKK